MNSSHILGLTYTWWSPLGRYVKTRRNRTGYIKYFRSPNIRDLTKFHLYTQYNRNQLVRDSARDDESELYPTIWHFIGAGFSLSGNVKCEKEEKYMGVYKQGCM